MVAHDLPQPTRDRTHDVSHVGTAQLSSYALNQPGDNHLHQQNAAAARTENVGKYGLTPAEHFSNVLAANSTGRPGDAPAATPETPKKPDEISNSKQPELVGYNTHISTAGNDTALVNNKKVETTTSYDSQAANASKNPAGAGSNFDVPTVQPQQAQHIADTVEPHRAQAALPPEYTNPQARQDMFG